MRERLRKPRYPRSAAYDGPWMVEGMMGPNAVWLTEALTQVMPQTAGTRVLDLGCGRVLSSTFLAREFDVQVWATDLWISATENLRRVREAGLDRRVFPLHADARALPFADGFFDAVVSVDAYHYFGTDDLYLGTHLARLLKPGGRIGIVVPGVTRELGGVVPDWLQPFWDWQFATFHTPSWWRRSFEAVPGLTVEVSEMLPDGRADWITWEDICAEVGANPEAARREADMLRSDGEDLLGFVRLVARTAG